MKKFKRQIASWTMIPSDGGKFEVTADGKALYSKLEQGRFPTNEEVMDLIETALKKTATV